VSSQFLTRVGVHVCVCLCIRTHTHTHTAHGVLDVGSGFGTRHLKGPKNPDGLHLGIFEFENVCKVYICIHMLGGEMGSGLTVFSR